MHQFYRGHFRRELEPESERWWIHAAVGANFGLSATEAQEQLFSVLTSGEECVQVFHQQSSFLQRDIHIQQTCSARMKNTTRKIESCFKATHELTTALLL